MQRKPLILTGAVLAVALSWQLASALLAAEGLDGKKLFLDQKCDSCHSVSSAGIAATVKVEKMKGPDLSGHVKGELAETAAFLRQEKERDGVKHKKAVKATDAEIQAILDWLASQPKPPAGKP